MKWRITLLQQLLLLAFASTAVLAQGGNYDLSTVAGFEGTLPAFWTMGNQPTGATLTWATDSSRSLGYSLKIAKPSATTDSASWISMNMADIWSPNFPKNVDVLVGAWILTKGVNVNPASDDQRWWISYAFYDSAGALLTEDKLPIDQSKASSSGWVADTNQPGEVILLKDAWKLIIKFVAGKNATGTVWADDFVLYGRGGQWAGQDWNTSVGVPMGYYYWLPPNGGNDALLANGFENTRVTTEAAHSGTHSLKFVMPANRQPHDGFVSTIRLPYDRIGPNINPGDSINVSVWIKASGLVPDSAKANPSTWAVGLTPQYFKKIGNNAGFDATGPDYQFVLPSVTSFDWTKFTQGMRVPGDYPAGMEIRYHVYSRFAGTVYFDDMTVTRVVDSARTLAAIGGFEAPLPSFWMMGSQPTGATLSWATDSSRSLGHSLKIVKPGATTDSAAWTSENMANIWSPTFPKNVDALVGAYVRTQGVNTNPGADSARWWISYAFYDSAGTLLTEDKLPIDQSKATSTGWIADTNQPGETILLRDAWKLIIKFVAGKNATGTVWADDFVLYGRGGQWAGQDWNTGLGVPTGWYYWLPPNGGNDALLANGFENTRVTTEAAHSGTHSLKFVLPANRQPHDAFVGTVPMPFSGFGPDINQGDSIAVSVWIKASGLVPDSAAANLNTWSVGITPQFLKKVGNNAGYDATGSDYMFAFPAGQTSFDWTKFTQPMRIPNDGRTGMEIRLHAYSRMVGTLYFDDVTVTKISGPLAVPEAAGVAKEFALMQNYPNPFNPTTTIRYTLPKEANVQIVVYNMLGQVVRTLVDAHQAPGSYATVWDGRDNRGLPVGTGVYIYRMTGGLSPLVHKMLLLK